MNESEYGPRTRRRAAIAIATLLGFVLALFPFAPAHAASSIGVTVTSPTVDDDYAVGSVMTIEWATNATAPVKIELYDENGGSPIIDPTFGTVKASVPAKPSKFNWTIPMALSTGAYRVKVTTLSGTIVSDMSDTAWQAVLPTTTFSSPRLNDVVSTGATKVLKWTTGATGSGALDLVDLSNTVVAPIKSSVSAKSGTFSWNIPVNAVTASGSYKVRFQETAGTNTVTDYSSPFTVNLATLSLTQPTASGITWGAGTVQKITWSTGAPGSVRIEVIDTANSNHVEYTKIVPSKPNAYNWTIPTDFPILSTFKVRVTSMTGTTVNSGVTDLSANTFSVATSTVTVSQPDNTSTWVTGSTGKKIVWTTPVVGAVQVDLVDTTGGLIRNIRATTPSTAGATSSVNWDIPIDAVTQSGQYKVMVTTKTANPVVGMSAAFQLDLPTITVDDAASAPWSVTTSHPVTWSTNMTSGTVRIDLIDSSSLTVVANIRPSVTAHPGSYTWAIPATLATGSYKIKISSVAAPTLVSGLNTNAFSINLPTVTVNAPANVTAGAGTSLALGWTTALTGLVKIDLTDNTGGLVSNIKSSVAVSPAAYNWAVLVNAVTSTGTYKVRVTSTSNPAITGLSAGFTITNPTITVSAPTATPTWAKGSAQTVTWTSTLAAGQNVRIEVISGTTVVSILKTSVLASALSSGVTIPSTLTGGQTYSIRVVAVSNSGITDKQDFVA
jgi:hypothetical protein